MENKSNPSNARERQKVSLFLEKKAEIISDFFESCDVQIVPKKNKADFYLNYENNLFSLTDAKNNLSLNISNKEDLLSHLNTLNLIIPDDFIDLRIEEFKDYNKKMSKQVFDIPSFIEYFGKLGKLKSYSSFQILLHEKGQTACHSYTFDKTTNFQTNTISVSTFTSLLNKIKKSKNKQFDAKELKYSDIKFISSFVAKELEFTDITLIIMASRNDLFSINKEEKNYFSDFLTYSKYFIHKCGLFSIKKNRFEVIEKIIHNFPVHFNIEYNGKVISSNSSKTNNGKVEYDHTDLVQHSKLVLMGELLNTLSHELSNPLFGIAISSSILQEDYNDQTEVQQTIQAIELSAKRCQNIIKNFSDLYNENSSYQDTDLKNLIEETITLTKSETRFIRKKVTFNNFKDSFIININPTYLSQIIFNLVLNSAQAINEAKTPESNISIEVDNLTSYIDINVIDNGPGISAADNNKIFNPFFTTKKSGTGLGLAICQKLAKNINAEIFLNNKLDNHTCLTLRMKNCEIK